MGGPNSTPPPLLGYPEISVARRLIGPSINLKNPFQNFTKKSQKTDFLESLYYL